MTTPDDDATRAALAVMTAWATSDTVDFAAETAAQLSGQLLTYIDGELDRTPEQTLQWIATRPWNERGHP